MIDGEEVAVRAGEILCIPPHVPHEVIALEDSVALDIFNPPRQDWIDGDDAYLRARTAQADKKPENQLRTGHPIYNWVRYVLVQARRWRLRSSGGGPRRTVADAGAKNVRTEGLWIEMPRLPPAHLQGRSRSQSARLPQVPASLQDWRARAHRSAA